MNNVDRIYFALDKLDMHGWEGGRRVDVLYTVLISTAKELLEYADEFDTSIDHLKQNIDNINKQ